MIAVDTNILVYAHREDSSFHGASLEVLLDLVETKRRWGIPWPCVHEFVSVVTHPRIYDPPSPLNLALSSIQVWLEVPQVITLAEGPGYWETVKGLCLQSKLKGPMVHDARIAALCIHHGVSELWSADRDFSRFSPLKVRNPLVG